MLAVIAQSLDAHSELVLMGVRNVVLAALALAALISLFVRCGGET